MVGEIEAAGAGVVEPPGDDRGAVDAQPMDMTTVMAESFRTA